MVLCLKKGTNIFALLLCADWQDARTSLQCTAAEHLFQVESHNCHTSDNLQKHQKIVTYHTLYQDSETTQMPGKAAHQHPNLQTSVHPPSHGPWSQHAQHM